jgi:hypothetical protein
MLQQRNNSAIKKYSAKGNCDETTGFSFGRCGNCCWPRGRKIGTRQEERLVRSES